MGKHLDALILAQIKGRILVNRLRLACAHILDHQTQRLLVRLNQLRLTRILFALDTRRQDIVDRCLLAVLFQTHAACVEGSATGCTKRLVIGTPLAHHEVEGTETQHDRFLETGEEHTHEADAGEIVDVALTALKLIDRYTELIPGNGRLGIITPGLAVFTLIYNMIVTYHEIFRTDADTVLEVFLIFVEGIILVDILDIRR